MDHVSLESAFFEIGHFSMSEIFETPHFQNRIGKIGHLKKLARDRI